MSQPSTIPHSEIRTPHYPDAPPLPGPFAHPCLSMRLAKYLSAVRHRAGEYRKLGQATTAAHLDTVSADLSRILIGPAQVMHPHIALLAQWAGERLAYAEHDKNHVAAELLTECLGIILHGKVGLRRADIKEGVAK